MITQDIVNFITRYEEGQCDDIEVYRGFQTLIDTGVVYHLQGSYGRTADELIEAGHCKRPGAGFINPSCPNGQCGID